MENWIPVTLEDLDLIPLLDVETAEMMMVAYYEVYY